MTNGGGGVTELPLVTAWAEAGAAPRQASPHFQPGHQSPPARLDGPQGADR
jgi:hypothetical protein